jgi:hypothetical protein
MDYLFDAQLISVDSSSSKLRHVLGKGAKLLGRKSLTAREVPAHDPQIWGRKDARRNLVEVPLLAGSTKY